MSDKPTTETDAADNVDETAKDSTTETTETTDETAKGSKDEEDGSNVTPREKELRRLLRENEKELKRLRKAEEEARRAEMTENEKLREELDSSKSELERLLRKSIAAEYGLDADLADRLRGVTEEELIEDAKRLAELVKPPKPSSKDVGIGVPGKDELPNDPVSAHRHAMAGRAF